MFPATKEVMRSCLGAKRGWFGHDTERVTRISIEWNETFFLQALNVDGTNGWCSLESLIRHEPSRCSRARHCLAAAEVNH